MNPREQGDIGEFSALGWFAEQGAKVGVPLGHSPDYDLFVDWGDRVEKVQVKTTGYFRNGRWCVLVCTRGGNRSWTGVAKYFSPERCDALFVHVADGRRWYIPSTSIEATTSVLLGGPKYAAFEVEAGKPFAATLRAPAAGFPSGQRDVAVNHAA